MLVRLLVVVLVLTSLGEPISIRRWTNDARLRTLRRLLMIQSANNSAIPSLQTVPNAPPLTVTSLPGWESQRRSDLGGCLVIEGPLYLCHCSDSARLSSGRNGFRPGKRAWPPKHLVSFYPASRISSGIVVGGRISNHSNPTRDSQKYSDGGKSFLRPPVAWSKPSLLTNFRLRRPATSPRSVHSIPSDLPS